MIVYAKSVSSLHENEIIFRGEKEGIEEVRELFQDLRKKHHDNWSEVRNALLEFYRSIPDNDPREPLKRYTKVDERGPYRDDGNINWPGGGGPTYEVVHPTTKKPCKLPTSGWRYPTPLRFWEEVEKGRIVFGIDETTVPRVRMNLFDNFDQVMTSVHYSYAQTAANEFNAIFDGKRVFENPKPVKDLRRLVSYIASTDGIILDFFAGSGSTAQAVMELNAVDAGSRQVILVQLPEKLDESSEAYKAGYRTIADITRARIEKVIAKLKAEQPENTADLACAYFTLAPSNFKVWRGDVADIESLRAQMDMFQQAEKSGSSSKETDLQTAMLAELLLKHGLGALGVHAISKPTSIAGVTVHRVLLPDDRQMWLCFEPYKEELKEEIAKAKPSQVVLLNSCFTGDKADEQLSNLQLELAGLDISLTVI